MSISKLNCTLEKLLLATAITIAALAIATPVSSQKVSLKARSRRRASRLV